MSEFGSGPSLSRDLDFTVTTTGDIEAVSGVEELEKDLALQSLIELQEFEGATQTPRTKVIIQSRVNQILTNDPRVQSVSDIQVTFTAQDNSAEIVAGVSTDDGEQELVFEV